MMTPRFIFTVCFVNCHDTLLKAHLHTTLIGFAQGDEPWMDGVPGVTQYPIQPGGNYTYTVTPTGQVSLSLLRGEDLTDLIR